MFRYCLVWDKVFPGNFVRAKIMPMRHHEDLVVFAAKMPNYNPQMVLKDKPTLFKQQKIKASESAGVYKHDPLFTKLYTHTYPRSIFVTSRRAPRGQAVHPTQKPVALLEWLIATYTNPGDLILDPVAGPGTTGIAAPNLGRRAVLIEKDPVYFEGMCKRIAEHQQKTAAASK